VYTYIINEIRHDADYIVTAVIFTKALSENENVSCNVMFELLQGPGDFIPYENLTEETVVSWLEQHSDMASLNTVLEKTQKQIEWETATSFPWS
jgi:hypothetical protein